MAINGLAIFNTLIIIGIVVSAFLAVILDNLLSSVIALGATGAFVALAFLVLQAPDVALAEAAVGAVLSTVLFIVALRKVQSRKKEDEAE